MNLLAFQFGINEALCVIILVLSIGMILSELKVKRKTDLITNVIIAGLLYGVSIYNLVTIGFSQDSILVTVVYCITICSASVFTILFVYHYKKYSKEELEQNKEENIEEVKEEDNKEENSAE